eukprot:1190773-Prorocentrum_minimum.AAC.2
MCPAMKRKSPYVRVRDFPTSYGLELTTLKNRELSETLESPSGEECGPLGREESQRNRQKHVTVPHFNT